MKGEKKFGGGGWILFFDALICSVVETGIYEFQSHWAMIAAFLWSLALAWMWRSLGNMYCHRQEDSLQKKLQQQHHDLLFVSINMKSPLLPLLKECRWVCSYCPGYRPKQKEMPCSFIGTSVSLKDSVPGIVWHIVVEENLFRFLPLVLSLIFMVLSSQSKLLLPLMYVNELIQVAVIV